MRVEIASGLGIGSTTLAAFDGALIAAGVANYNLIRLSSVIPPGTDLVPLDGPASPSGGWGDRLYVVMAEQREMHAGHEAWAGIGWVQGADHGPGLFVEHHGRSRAEVESDLHASLASLTGARGIDLGPVHTQITGTTCDGTPCCALVVAVFASAAWG